LRKRISLLYDNIPIFPLKSIVLPGGLFPLRIFERRYIDMITECMKEEEGFCIALTKTEEPNLYVTDIYEYGSFVKITDWGQLNDGLLSITVEGKNIVKILKSNLNDSGLLNGTIEHLESEKEYMIPQKYLTLSKFYKKIYPGIKNFINFKEERYADASWIGFRLTECLPLDLPTKANLISINNAIDRLEVIDTIIHKLYKEEISQL
tara:strand:- start:1236 stop:1856 length:621 start_codon:yes stop_codon:yes gene_type:complete